MSYPFLSDLKQAASSHGDLRINAVDLRGITVWIAGMDSLINRTQTQAYLQSSLPKASCSFEELAACLLGEFVPSSSNLLQKLLHGRLAVISEDGLEAFVLYPAPANLQRSIEPPKEESVIGTSSLSFVEDLTTNIGLLRRVILSEDLCVENFVFHGIQEKRLALVYLRNEAPALLVNNVRSKLLSQSLRPAQSQQDLIALLGGKRYQLISPTNT